VNSLTPFSFRANVGHYGCPYSSLLGRVFTQPLQHPDDPPPSRPHRARDAPTLAPRTQRDDLARAVNGDAGAGSSAREKASGMPRGAPAARRRPRASVAYSGPCRAFLAARAASPSRARGIVGG
jgi:hypothetical protein